MCWILTNEKSGVKNDIEILNLLYCTAISSSFKNYVLLQLFPCYMFAESPFQEKGEVRSKTSLLCQLETIDSKLPKIVVKHSKQEEKACV